jgi:hypothetical protein
MGGGLMQLVAYGAQDFYLTGNPQITFFKVVYRRHTNFATESIEQTFTGNPNWGSRVVCNLQRSGDLVTKMYFRATLPSGTLDAGKWAWAPRVGHVIMEDVYMEIGGTQIDKHYNDWLNIWYELARNFAQDRGYGKMIGNTSELTTLEASHEQATLWVPLQFACCRNDGLALPIIALQYHDVKLTFDLANLDQLVQFSGTTLSVLKNTLSLQDCSLYVDYVYLDNEERKRFAQASHEYLFEQLQFTGAETTNGANNKYRLNLNHPCKELVWVTKLDKWTNGSTFLAYDQDFSTLQKLATARFVLRTANYDSSGNLDLGDNSGNQLGNLVISSTNTNSDVSGIFAEVIPAALTNDANVNNITILGRMLTVEEMSRTINQWNFTSNPKAEFGEGATTHDVTVSLNNNYGMYIDGSVNPTQSALLQLNGHDRFTQREGDYFNYVQPWQCHTNTPADGVNVYSFALNPEEHQPSGTCNMSRIDNATLNIRFDQFIGNSASFLIFATNYNVLRVMSGMGGLAYSN